MPRFIYQARNNTGQNDSGVLTAGSVGEASQILRKEGKTIVSLREETAADGVVQSTTTNRKRVKRDDVIYFATQLAVMVDTGVPLAEALDAIADQTDQIALRTIVQDIADQVKGGVEFSTAMEKYPKIFGELFVALMRASEASGTMGQMLQRVSSYLQQEQETRKRIKGAMTYPVCMLGFCVLVVVGMLVFILPRFEKIYSGKDSVLPLPTRFLMGLSGAMINYWPLVLGGAVAVVIGLNFFFRSRSGKLLADKIRISTPIIGPMYRKSYLSRSLRTMATMVSTGVGILDGLRITAEVAGNAFYASIWTELAERAKEGSTLSEQLFEEKLIPRTIAQMISAGEKTGQLGVVMNRVAGFCEDDLKIAVKTVTSMIEPIMIVIMGLIVGGIAMALLLPIFSISKVIAH
ncbi:MAG: type II secretion system F family protein [Planctomycetota bacterium]|nr:type II secretion system F family protein [Planctomycetota bacterium]